MATRLHRSILHLTGKLRSRRRHATLNPSALLALGLIYRNPGTQQTFLAAELGVQPQSLTRLLAALEKQGLISKDANPADARKNRLRLTEAGSEALAADMHERRVRLATALHEGMTEQDLDILEAAAVLLDKAAAAVPRRDPQQGPHEHKELE